MCKKVKKTDEPDLPNGLDKKITKQNPLKPFRKNDKIEWNFLKSISYVNISTLEEAIKEFLCLKPSLFTENIHI